MTFPTLPSSHDSVLPTTRTPPKATPAAANRAPESLGSPQPSGSDSLTPYLTGEALIRSAIAKHRQHPATTFCKAVLAGLFLGLGAAFYQLISSGSDSLKEANPGLLKVVSAFVFPLGIISIVLTGQELLTSNMMIFPMAAIHRHVPLWGLALNWFIVFFGNLAGSLFCAAIMIHYADVFTGHYAEEVAAAAVTKCVTPQWHQIFIRAIGCNILVNIAIWQSASARETASKILGLHMPIWAFVALGYDHVVANMYIIPVGMLSGAEISIGFFIYHSLIPAFLGNVVGALILAVPFTFFFVSRPQRTGVPSENVGENLEPSRRLYQLNGSVEQGPVGRHITAASQAWTLAGESAESGEHRK